MLIRYTTEDGKSRIQLRAKDHTAWLSQREMAQLFDVTSKRPPMSAAGMKNRKVED